MSANSTLSDRQVLLLAVLRGDWAAIGALLDDIYDPELESRWRSPPPDRNWKDTYGIVTKILKACDTPYSIKTKAFGALCDAVDHYFLWQLSLKRLRELNPDLSDLVKQDRG